MQSNILIKSIPLSKITKVDPEITESFLQTLSKQISGIKENPTHFIINSLLTINTPHFIQVYQSINVLLQQARQQCHLLQLTKN